MTKKKPSNGVVRAWGIEKSNGILVAEAWAHRDAAEKAIQFLADHKVIRVKIIKEAKRKKG